MFTSSNRQLINELSKYIDDFVTVRLADREYVIDSIGHSKVYTNGQIPHICINIRDCGDGMIKR